MDREWRREGERHLEAAAGDLFLRLLADALDRLAVAEARHPSELAVRRLDPVAVEHKAKQRYVGIGARALKSCRNFENRAVVAGNDNFRRRVLIGAVRPRNVVIERSI